MDQQTECVTPVENKSENTITTTPKPMSEFTKLYYKLTAWYPRLIPSSKEEWESLRHTLKEVFNIDDDPMVWYAVYSRAQGSNNDNTRLMSIRRSYLDLVNTTKRLKINKAAQDEKILAAEKIEADAKRKMEEAAKKVASEEANKGPILPQWSDVQTGTPNPEG